MQNGHIIWDNQSIKQLYYHVINPRGRMHEGPINDMETLNDLITNKIALIRSVGLENPLSSTNLIH